jgi:hypothetical protein
MNKDKKESKVQKLNKLVSEINKQRDKKTILFQKIRDLQENLKPIEHKIIRLEDKIYQVKQIKLKEAKKLVIIHDTNNEKLDEEKDWAKKMYRGGYEVGYKDGYEAGYDKCMEDEENYKNSEGEA